MSNGDATFHRWITRTRFRDCSTRQSRSKAGLYPCALRMIANHAEPTFALLRYAFGGNRPSQTDPLTRSPARIHGFGVRQPTIQGRYFTVGSPDPDEPGSQPPAYPTHEGSDANVRLQ